MLRSAPTSSSRAMIASLNAMACTWLGTPGTFGGADVLLPTVFVSPRTMTEGRCTKFVHRLRKRTRH